MIRSPTPVEISSMRACYAGWCGNGEPELTLDDEIVLHHTPGPWAVHPVFARIIPADHLSRPIGGHEDDAQDLAIFAQEICAMHWPDRHRSELEVRANASLIAAAPDLLQAAVKAQAWFLEHTYDLSDADRAKWVDQIKAMSEVEAELDRAIGKAINP